MALPGEEIWRFQAGSPDGYDYAYGVSADVNGSFFLAGQAGGSFDGVTANEGEKDLIVTKIDTDGSLLWSWQDGAEGDDTLLSAAATDDGGVVVGGYSNGSYNGVASEGLVDFIAIKLDSDGAVEWQWQGGTDTDDVINTCSKTSDGHVVLTGGTEADWAGTGATPGFVSTVVIKLDVTDGTVLWQHQTGIEEASLVILAAATRADGSIVLGGSTTGDWDRELVGNSDFAAVALDEDGVELWRWQDGPAGSVNIMHGVAALSDGSVVLVGSTEGDYAGENAGGLDFVIVKLTAGGLLDWSWQDGTLHNDEFAGVATGIDGTSVVMGGYTMGSWVEINEAEGEAMDFAGMSMDTDGSSLWAYQSGTAQYNDFNNVAVRPDGAALLVGWTNDEFLETATTNNYSDFAGVLIETGAIASSSTPAAVERSSSSSSSVPLGPIIGGCVGGVALLALIFVIRAKVRAKHRHREGC